MRRLTVEDMGTEAQGVRLLGDPKKRPEPTHFRVVFPGGDVDIVRTTDDQYWVHVRVNTPEDCVVDEWDTVPGRLVDARLDIKGRNASEIDAGDFGDPRLYHLAVRVEPLRAGKKVGAKDQASLLEEAPTEAAEEGR